MNYCYSELFMKHKLEEFFEILKLDRKNSAWGRQETMENRHKELINEVEEIGSALETGDIQNLKEELGDALWNILFMYVIAEEKNLFSAKESIESAITKMKRRKPWIFTDEIVDIPEEKRRWKEAKRLEKNK